MKNKINELFDAEVASVENAFPSIYNKDNVITLLNNLKAKINMLDEPSDVSTDTLNKLKDEVISVIENFDYDDSIDICLGYNDRSLEVDFETRELVREIEVAFDEVGVI